MTKKDKILSFYKKWKNENITLQEVADASKSSINYTREVFNKKELLKDLEKVENKRIEIESRNVIEPDYKVEDQIKGETYKVDGIFDKNTREIKPKVNLLPDGKVELIYQSKMNYE